MYKANKTMYISIFRTEIHDKKIITVVMKKIKFSVSKSIFSEYGNSNYSSIN